MAVNRRILQQALANAGQIQQQAASGKGFDPRGGYGVLAAQLGTAAIGAFAQKRANDKLMEIEKQEQMAFGKALPQFAGLASQLSPETRQALILKQASAQIDSQFARPEFSTRDTAQGVVRINEATGEVIPLTTQTGETLQPFKKAETIVNVGGEEPAFRKKLEEGLGTKTAEVISKIRTDADNAVGVLTNLDTIEENLKNVGNTGVLDTAKIFLNNLGNQLGFDINLDETASLEKINAASKELSVPLVKQLGVNPTDRDAKIIEATVAGLGKSKQANFDLISLTRQIANKKLAHAKIVDNLRDEGREQEISRAIRQYDLNNPIKQPARAIEPPTLANGKLDVSKLRKGKLYIKNNQIFEFDGVKFIAK